MNIAITGATGFLGEHLIEELKIKNLSYSIFDRKKHDLFKPETLKDLIEGKDIVIHLAGINIGPYDKIMNVNVLGTLGLLDAMVKYSPNSKIIFASTFQVYVPHSLYGLSKKFAEEIINYYVFMHKIKALVFRLTNVYGEGCKPFYNSVIATFIDQIKHKKPIFIYGDETRKRDYLYVEDTVDAIVKAVFFDPTNIEYFDICSGKLISINKIVKILSEIYPNKIKVVYNKQVKVSDWGLKKNFIKANKLLKWKPQTLIEQGLKMAMQG